MKAPLPRRTALAVAVALALLSASPATPQPLRSRTPSAKPRPRPEAVAETKLLMEGLLQPNVRSLENHLRQPPADVDTWTFMRGQSLLIAETGNLLMLRPPKSSGQDVWLEYAAELRDRATQLAQQVAARDTDRGRAALVGLSKTCNRCHQAFRVQVRITPFAEAE